MLTLPIEAVTSGRHCQLESGVPAKDVAAINLGYSHPDPNQDLTTYTKFNLDLV